MHIQIFDWLFELIYIATGGGVAIWVGARSKTLGALAAAVAIIMAFYFYRDHWTEWFGAEKSELSVSREAPRSTPAVLPADEIFWLTIKDAAAPGLFQEFIRNFPASSHIVEARARLEQIKGALPPLPSQEARPDAERSTQKEPPIRCVQFNGRKECG
jgi:hypothetical protein